MSINRHEHLGPELIASPESYFADERVMQAILNFAGVEGNHWAAMVATPHEYLGVSTEAKMRDPVKKSPLSTIFPDELPARIQAHQGRLELYVSFMHRALEGETVPQRLLLCWDLDRFRFKRDNNYDEGSLIHDERGTFASLQAALDLYRDFFASYGVEIMTVTSGKGLHIFTQVTDPAVIRQIQQIGGRIEPTIAGKLAHAAEARNKARTAISLFHEQGFKGQGRLQQWVNTQLINPVRRHTHLAVEIWDKGRPGEGTDGIALDNTFGVFHVNNKVIGALGSPYFLKAMRSGASLGRWILQLPVAGLNFDSPIHQVLQARRDFAQSARLLGQVDTHVPDGSQGIARMIQDYQGSDLERLHQAMDNSWGDEPQTFDAGYRRDNYEAIIRQTRQPEVVRNSIQYANPMLLQNRFFLDHLIFQVFAAMGGSPDNLAPAPHVAGLLRAIYEDPRYGWGETWTRHQDALRWARGSVEQALGQMFEK